MLKLMQSEQFLKMQGLNNEVPFFICPYPPKVALKIERMRNQLISKLETSSPQVRVLDINLYDISLDILKKEGDLEYYLENEEQIGKQELFSDLQGILDVENVMIPEIARRMGLQSFDVMFISGVGEVFPYIRSSNLLNNLQSRAKEHPTVMFYPGEYRYSIEFGASLSLFEVLHDDKYYRAFNIFNLQV
jgi:hypothetical protein